MQNVSPPAAVNGKTGTVTQLAGHVPEYLCGAMAGGTASGGRRGREGLGLEGGDQKEAKANRRIHSSFCALLYAL